VNAEESFRAQLDPSKEDQEIAELRRILTHAKLEALEQVEDLSEAGLQLVIPGLYAQLVSAAAGLAGRVGPGVALALEAVDEQREGASMSRMSRDKRERMTKAAVDLKSSAPSAVERFVAEVSAQRLAWRHNHEFLSWLAFRRDERYPVSDRVKRFDAFKIHSRLLKSREAMRKLLGSPLTMALEGHDRFMLTHRWRMEPTEANRLEAASWLLLSFQPESVVELEAARLGVDANPEDEELASVVEAALVEQLAEALRHLPKHALRPGQAATRAGP
jgi:hypothetical protein